ncbi:MAG: hypothetical protein DMG09_11565 [Acidobacteria bacterium]|nr:MAG: hypothetical protein DMG09_11565 [Acidobacteriota bacterium]
MGVCGYHVIDWRNRSGEVGIIIGAREYWSQGFGTAAMQTLVGCGFIDAFRWASGTRLI